jgi:hypothetical protein
MKRLLSHLTALLLTFALAYTLTWMWEASYYFIKWEFIPKYVAPAPAFHCTFPVAHTLLVTQAQPAVLPVAKPSPRKHRQICSIVKMTH